MVTLWQTISEPGPSLNFRVADHADTIREVMRSGRSLGADKHRARVTVTSDRYDLAISYMDVLGEGNAAEDCRDIEDGDAVLAIHNEPDDSILFRMRAN